MSELSQEALLEIVGGDCSGMTGTVCDIATQMRSRILAKIQEAIQCSDPMTPIQVGNQRVDFMGYIASMQKLLQWTYDICNTDADASGPDVVITSAYELIGSYCCGSLPSSCGGSASSLSEYYGGKPAFTLPDEVMMWRGVYSPSSNSPVLTNGGGAYGDTYFVQSTDSGTVDFGSGPVTITGPALMIHNGAAYVVYQTSVRLTLAMAQNSANQTHGTMSGELLEQLRLVRSRVVQAQNGNTINAGFTYSIPNGATVTLANGTAYGDMISFFLASTGSCGVVGFGTIAEDNRRTTLYWNGTSWVQLDAGVGGGTANFLGEGPYTLTSGDIANGYINPVSTLSTADETFVDLVNGPSLTPFVDYSVTGGGTRITFTAECLTRLLAGDQVYIRRLVS